MNDLSSQEFESFVPVYDVVPDKWEDARPFLVEILKKISNAVNIREIGWYLDEELLSGKALTPVAAIPGDASPQQFRQILRKVIDMGPLVIGINSVPHGILFDFNFTLVEMSAAVTNTTTFVAEPIPNIGPDGLSMDATNVNILSAAAWDRCLVIIQYCQEV